MALRQAREDFDHGRDDALADLQQRLDQRLGVEDGVGIGLEQQGLVGEARSLMRAPKIRFSQTVALSL